MKAQSAEVLNEADRQQRIIDWILFKQEQGHLLRYIEGEWNVGDPIWQRPSHLTFALVGQQYIRPMFEEMGMEEFHLGRNDNLGLYFNIRCEDCEVSWEGPDPCFVCGKILTRLGFAARDAGSVMQEFDRVWAEHMRELNRRREEQMQNFYRSMAERLYGRLSVNEIRQSLGYSEWTDEQILNDELATFISVGPFDVETETFTFRIPIIDLGPSSVRDTGENVRLISQEMYEQIRVGIIPGIPAVRYVEPEPEPVIVNGIEFPDDFDIDNPGWYAQLEGYSIHIVANLGEVRRQIEERGWPSSRPVWMR